jgi:hypothetical protein
MNTLGNIKHPLPISGSSQVNKAINMAGGISVGRATAREVGQGSFANLASIGKKITKKGHIDEQQFDLLTFICSDQKEALYTFMQEKKASHWGFGYIKGALAGQGLGNIIRGGSSSIPKLHTPAPNRFVRLGGGLAGAATTYSAARNDGSGAGASLGLAAVGGLAGQVVGHSLGKEVSQIGAATKALHGAGELQTIKKTEDNLAKFVDPEKGKEHSATTFLANLKNGHNKVDANGKTSLMESAKAVGHQVQHEIYKVANPNGSAQDYLHSRGYGDKLDKYHADRIQDHNMFYKQNENHIQNMHELNHYGAGDVEHKLMQQIGNTDTVKGVLNLNRPDFLNNKHVIKAITSSGANATNKLYGTSSIGFAKAYAPLKQHEDVAKSFKTFTDSRGLTKPTETSALV